MKVLVFPSTTEIGHEVIRSLEYEKGIEIVKASSIKGEGHYLPYVDDPEFHKQLAQLIQDQEIEHVIPTNEAALMACSDYTFMPKETIEICNSKRKTYEKLPKISPKVYDKDNIEFPAFAKPDIGHSGKGARRVLGRYELRPDDIFTEYLPGKEYTVDCFTHNGELLYYQGRQRDIIANGISVSTAFVNDFMIDPIAEYINDNLNLKGAWFFQVKEDAKGNFKLMEVGARISGSSAINRLIGVNLTLLSLYASEGIPFTIQPMVYVCVSINRKLDITAKLPTGDIYVDLDDTLLINGKINGKLYGWLLDCGREVKVITRNAKVEQVLKQHGILFSFIYVPEDLTKASMASTGILIDDSFRERSEWFKHFSNPALSPDAILSYE